MKSHHTILILATILSITWIVYGAQKDAEEITFHEQTESAEIPLACHSAFNITLDQNGIVVLTPELVLADTFSNYDRFRVEITDPPLHTNIATCDQVNQRLEVTVFDSISGNMCWSFITIEDKWAPIITCDTLILPCTFNPLDLPDSITPTSMSDNCTDSADLVLTYVDDFNLLDCSTGPYVAQVKRTWTVKDESGRSASCMQIILFEKGDIGDIEFPADTTIPCSAIDTSIETNGEPTLGGLPLEDLCMIAVTYNDTRLQACGGTFKILREWIVADWCNGGIIRHTQTIKVIDEEGPIIDCPSDVIIEATSNCEANYSIPPIQAIDACGGDVNLYFRVDGVPTSGTITGLGLGDHTIEVIAQDECLNLDTCYYTVTVQDMTHPWLQCKDSVIVVLNNMGMATIPYDGFDYDVYDNCGIIDTAIRRIDSHCDRPSDLSFGDDIKFCCDDLFQPVMVEIKVTDINGLTNSCMFIVEVQDMNGAVLTCPSDRIIDCDKFDINDYFGSPTVSASCPVTLDSIETLNINDCGVGVYERTFIATSANGMTTQCTQTITIQNPYSFTIDSFIIPADISLDVCDADTSIANTGTPTVLDNLCDNITVSHRDSIPANGSNRCYDIYRIWTAQDACNPGDPIVDIQVISLVDDIPPTITCPPDTVVDCTADISISNLGTPTATDNCGEAGNFFSVDSVIEGSCPNHQIIARIWTVSDSCQNKATCIQLIDIRDLTPPVITCPVDTILECPADTSVTILGSAIAVDNCSATVEISYVDEITAGSCPLEFLVKRTWTAIDECGNSSFCEQQIEVVDTAPPSITCPSDNTVECPADTSVAVQGIAIADDACDQGIVEYNDIVTPGSCPQSFTVTRTWTAVDACGNSSSCVQTIEVEDTTPPSITCPATVTIECGDDSSPTNTGTATVTDLCDTDVTLTYDDETNGGTCAQSYEIERTWTATDACGNISTCVQIILVEDNTPPTIDCPADVTINCSDDTSPTNTGSATANDLCDAAVDVAYNDVIIGGSCPQSYEIERTWTAEDDCGNSTTCVQIIAVEDNTPPTVDCPQDVTISCTDDDSPVNTGSATAVDDCDPNPSTSYVDDITPGTCANGYIITRTWSATDACGNTSLCVQIIDVEDITAPVITCPADRSIECPGDTSVATNGEATAVDDCNSAVISYSDVVTPGSCPQSYTVTRTWTATDDCGNTSSCVQTIEVEDTTPPSITCPSDLTMTCGADTTPANTGTPTATDGCSASASITIDYTDDVVILPTGELITRTWTATDECGNSSDCTQTLTIEGDNPPTIECPSDISLYLNPDSCHLYVSIPEPNVSDDCGILSVTNDGNGDGGLDASGIYPGGTTVITFIVTDLIGHTDTCTVTVELIDTIAPDLTCPPDMSIMCDDPIYPLSQFGNASASDNCPNVSVAVIDTIIDINGCSGGTVTRVFEATDANGNSVTCSQVITISGSAILDSTDILWPDQQVSFIGCAADIYTVPLPYPELAPTAGQCDPISVDTTITPVVPATFGCKTFEVVYTVTDDCNYDPISGSGQWVFIQTVGISDTTAPVINPITAVGPFYADTFCLAEVTLANVTATDNCGAGMLTITNNSPYATNNGPNASGEYPGGTTIVEFVATDMCGNESSFELEIIVLDTIPPRIVCSKHEYPIDDNLQAIVYASDAFRRVSDNCTDSVDVLLSFSRTDPTDTIRIFGCDSALMVFHEYVYATDEAGNIDSCIVTIGIDDSRRLCPGTPPPPVSGRVFNAQSQPIPEVEIAMAQHDGMHYEYSSTDGEYTFLATDGAMPMRLDADKSDHILNGLSAYDLFLMKKHILADPLLDNPYLKLAADVNNDKTIDVRDVIYLQKVLLGYEESFKVPIWQFYDAHYHLINDPFNQLIPEYVMIYGVLGMYEADFVGVKTGDLDYSTELMDDARPRGRSKTRLSISADIKHPEKDDWYAIYLPDLQGVQGGQIQLSYAPGIIEQILPNELNGIYAQEINDISWRGRGMRIVWADKESRHFDEKNPIAWIKLRAGTDLNGLNINLSDDFEQMVFDLSAAQFDLLLDVRLSNEEVRSDDWSYALYQNEPNPFDQSTSIQFSLPQVESYTLTIYDVQGRMIWQTEGVGQQGFNELKVDRWQLDNHKGLLHYRLETDNFNAMRKMLLTE